MARGKLSFFLCVSCLANAVCFCVSLTRCTDDPRYSIAENCAQTAVISVCSSLEVALGFCCCCFSATMKADRKVHLTVAVSSLCRREEVRRWKSCPLRKLSLVTWIVSVQQLVAVADKQKTELGLAVLEVFLVKLHARIMQFWNVHIFNFLWCTWWSICNSHCGKAKRPIEWLWS